MNKRVRQGLGLVCVGLIVFVIGFAVTASTEPGGSEDAAVLFRSLGIWVGLVGLAFVAYGLVAKPSSD
jgi:hypothetical protein